jgi:hypothetical protein
MSEVKAAVKKKIIYQYSYTKTNNHLRMTYRDEPKDGDWNVNGEAVPVQTQLNRKIRHPKIKYFWWVHSLGYTWSFR